jgi:phosphoribosyl-dephospho-CoA transferase
MDIKNLKFNISSIFEVRRPLISFSLNIPGPKKAVPGVGWLMDRREEEILEMIHQWGIPILFQNRDTS